MLYLFQSLSGPKFVMHFLPLEVATTLTTILMRNENSLVDIYV
jgi:hypothetical protein